MSQCLSSVVCSLKLLGSPRKTEASLRSLNLFSFIISFFLFPKFSQRIDQLSLSHEVKNSIKFALYLFATDEQVLALEEFDASKEHLEFNVYRITM